MNTDLERMIRSMAAAPVLLLASDFDGTLAPIVADPAMAAATPASIEAIRRLEALPHTHVAVISGRGLADLRSRVPVLRTMTLAGSHGAELEGTPPPPIPEATQEQMSNLAARLRTLASELPGLMVEAKPRAIVLHYRCAAPAVAQEALARVSGLNGEFSGLIPLPGSMVVEFVADRVHKGDALSTIRHRTGATGVMFLGDDRTDEDAFASLVPERDAGVKVGAGETLARYRVGGVDEVAVILSRLAEARAAWLAERRATPIQDHAVLSDQRTMALVDPRGRIVWMCLPRLDSAALFAELLDGPQAGYFQIAPVEAWGAEGVQEYVGDSMVVRTAWAGGGGQGCVLTDYLDCAGGRAFQRAGRTDLVRVVEGDARVRVVFAPRVDFGRTITRLSIRDGAVEVEATGDPVVLYAPGVAWRIVEDGRHHTAEAEIDLSKAGGVVSFELRYGSANVRAHPRPEPERRADTQRFWSAWAGSLRVPGVHAGAVRRSALLLRSLSHGPMGSIAAAATTSLPEHLGGVRNWDYRFCWPRDAALAAQALLRLGNSGTALRLLDWLLTVVDKAESPDRLRPMYTLTGADLGPEGEIGDLSGYGQSRPVRVGNAAAQQLQLDVFGPIVELIAMLADRGAPIAPDHWRLARAMVAAVESRWQEPDNGIWEIRGPKRQHVHSKAMCFLTVDRAMVVHEAVVGRPSSAWARLRDTIRADVLAHGYVESAGAFTTAYGYADLDAAALWVGLSGLVEAGDPRWARTVDAVDRRLRRGGVVDRYRFDDLLPGREGGFHVCTGWLIESFITLGRVGEARALLDGLVALAGPTGGLSEMFDPDLNIALGNYPQAYSHLALINAAVAVEAAERGKQA